MNYCPFRILLFGGLVMATLALRADEPNDEFGPRPIKLGTVPDLRPDRRLPLEEPQIRRIKNLIASLADLEKPDFGLSVTLSGDSFAPIAGQTQASTFLLTDHKIEPSESLKAIVSIGPRALPYLLAALDDQTPTKMVVRPNFGVMYHDAELHLNPVNSAEAVVYKNRPKEIDFDKEKEFIDSYVLKVGDVCFVAIGQIVGRSYSAVRYQPSAIVVLNCPTQSSKLCAEVRTIWKSDDARAKLFRSLLEDYSTEGVHRGNSLDSWGYGSQFQSPAALRLLYYFPEETAALIARRLDSLDVGADENLDSHMRRCLANGVRAKELINSIAWCKEPAIEAALLRIFKRAGDEDCLLAALPAVENGLLVRERLETFIGALPASESGPYGNGYHLLVALAKRSPETARRVYESYLNESIHRRHTYASPSEKYVWLGMANCWRRCSLTQELGDGRTRLCKVKTNLGFPFEYATRQHSHSRITIPN